MFTKKELPRPHKFVDKYRTRIIGRPKNSPKKVNRKAIEDLNHTDLIHRRRKGFCNVLRQNAFILFMMLGVCAGVGLGIGLRFTPAFSNPKQATRLIAYVNFPGELMLRVMSMLMVPVIVSSLVSAVASMDLSKTKKIGIGTIAYYLLTTTVAIIEGFIMIFTVRPGHELVGVHRPLGEIEGGNVSTTDAFMDMARNIFPDNLIAACVQIVKTEVESELITMNGTNITYVKESFRLRSITGVNIIGLTLWSIIFGLVFASMGPKAKVMVQLFQIIYEAVMKVFKILLWTYPVGICFMIAASVLRMVEPLVLLKMMGKLAASGTGGVLIHVFVTLPLLFFIFTRRNPFTFMKTTSPAWMTAFATYSSSATLPVTMECLNKLKHIDKRITRFMCPIGAVVNMDGTAIHEVMVIVFIATINGRVTGPGDILVAGLTTLAASIGTPTVGTMVAVYAILFSSMGLPLEDIALIIPFDWCLGRIRVVANIWGDCVGVAIVSHFSRHYHKKGNQRRKQQSDKSESSDEDEELSSDDNDIEDEDDNDIEDDNDLEDGDDGDDKNAIADDDIGYLDDIDV